MPEEILVVANFNAFKSVDLARYYMKKRSIPKSNLIRLWVDDEESCSRSDYNDKIAEPIRRFLREKDSQRKIRALVTMYGLPLKIQPSKKGKKTKQELDKKIDLMQDDMASVDSELALLLVKDYPIGGWLPNPYFVGFKNNKLSLTKDDVLLVSRLDGPTEKIVKRIIDDSIFAERNGVGGNAYFDARWPEGNVAKSAYASYDRSIHVAAQAIKKNNLMDVILDESEKLFEPGKGLKAALYCGWYSLARYVDAFSWQRGSIGYHLASNECSTLKKKGSQVWCKMMLEKGVAATIGSVSEPYIQAFPVPEMFFTFLVDGRFNLVESFILSTPHISWKMVLIGDPLYRPFRKKTNI